MKNPLLLTPIVAQPPVWIINAEFPQLDHIREGAELTEEDFSPVLATATDILSRCPPPNGRNKAVQGIALGKIQSGKTLSFTTLIALAVENGYRNIIVMAGTKKPLLRQNYDRLYKDLGLENSKFRDKVKAFENPKIDKMNDIRSVHRLGMCALFVILKNRTWIDRLREILSNPEIQSTGTTLIIDDEGDEASLNTRFRSRERSAIYSSIGYLRGVLPKHAYIAYTATPQANLLQERFSSLTPDFCSLIEPGAGYCGGTVYFGEEIDNFVRIVPEDEVESQEVEGIADSLLLSLAIFLVGAAMRHLQNTGVKHRMLIHSSRLTQSHTQILSAIRSIIELWRTSLGTNSSDPSHVQLKKLFEKAYGDLSRTVQDGPSFDDVFTRIKEKEIHTIDTIMVNYLKEGEDPNTYQFTWDNNILIGGDKLGRGVTINGLAVTYMTRRARQTNADTLEQRARWFGYRKGYLDYCRVFLTEHLRDDYASLLEHEDDFWYSLRRNNRQNLPLGDWPRIFRLSTDVTIRPTRTNVASYRRFRMIGWEVQRHPQLSPKLAAANLQLVNQFFSKHQTEIRRFGSAEHGIIENVSVDTVVDKLIIPTNIQGTDWDSQFISEYLIRLALDKRLDGIDVLYMFNGVFRDRTAIGDTETINPFQGPSQNYCGDMDIHGGKVQLQVHKISFKRKNSNEVIETCVYALYLPDDEMYDLSFIMREDL
ncbi:MAG: Z1 domain-containing protein [Patescibacteria group bacterium]|nr:Z1 domain-containing protein [Patescibacteria group bacterium]